MSTQLAVGVFLCAALCMHTCAPAAPRHLSICTVLKTFPCTLLLLQLLEGLFSGVLRCSCSLMGSCSSVCCSHVQCRDASLAMCWKCQGLFLKLLNMGCCMDCGCIFLSVPCMGSIAHPARYTAWMLQGLTGSLQMHVRLAARPSIIGPAQGRKSTASLRCFC